ncbi:glycosyltransferase [Candidatus Woesebacteria bacterium]|nr:glycosyltransferase [Candidatus Woesebacteria bacterium]
MISIIIPTYNEEKVIENCLKSLSGQSYKDFEIIIVDDGSVDSTSTIVKNLKSRIINLKLFEQVHKGAGSARNLGAKHSKGKILVFVDADMTFDMDFIKKLVEPIEKGTTTGTFSNEEYLENKENVWAGSWNFNKGLPISKMHPDKYPNSQKVFRAILKSEFDKVGGFDEKAGYADDWSLSEKLGVQAVVAPGAIFYHKNPESLAEVFNQSRWVSKRKYKLGLIGVFVSLVRVSFPVSLILGIAGYIQTARPDYIIFKIVSDFGQFLGILEYSIMGRVKK